MTQFILLFTIILFLSALIINGWFSITSGRWELNTDGSKYWTGKILNKYSYWLQRHTIKTVAYSGEEWLKVLFQLKGFFPEKDIISISENYLLIRPMDEIKTTMFFAFAASKGIKVNVNIMPGDSKEKAMMIVAYKEIKEYKLHELIRDPLGMCINCMASVFGTILWVLWVLICGEINEIYPTDVATAFLGLGFFSKLVLWGMFCITLAYLNELIFNLNSKLKK